MKILHVYRTYLPDPPGGTQEAIRQISLATRAYNVESKVFTLSPSPIPNIIVRPEGCIIRSRSWLAPASCDLGGLDSFNQFKALVDWADIIHYHFPWPFADVLHQLCFVKKPAVMTYHSDIIRQRLLGLFYVPLMGRMLKSMSAVIATSPTYASSSAVLGKFVDSDKLRVIPLGIADYRDAEIDSIKEFEFIDRYDLRGSSFVLSLGVLRYYKGLHTLVEAASRVQGRIVIAGSGPEELSLKKLASEKKVNNILFLGQISNEEKIMLLKHCSLFVLPSHMRSEAFGMVLVEASMFGKPMVTCDIGSGTSYVNSDGETGLVVPPESPNELAIALNTLLCNKAMAGRMGVAARQRYESLFSSDILGRLYFELYRDVKNKKGN
jgi:glycosyltransferase involved in cell wall biosynthesis